MKLNLVSGAKLPNNQKDILVFFFFPANQSLRIINHFLFFKYYHFYFILEYNKSKNSARNLF